MEKSLKRGLFKNISILVSGTALAQLIPILLQPVLRRYYPPDIFGAYAVYTSLIGILITITSFKYELAIIHPKREKEAANLFFLSLFVNLLLNGIFALFIFVFTDSLLTFLNLSEKYKVYLFLVPLGTFLFSLYQNINYWLVRNKSFFQVSSNKFIRRGVEGGAQLSFQALQNFSGLIIGNILGHIAYVLAGLRQCVKRELQFNQISLIKLKYVARRYSEYPKYNLFPGFLSACSYLLPVLMINKFFSTDYAGYFDLSKLILSIPLALIATSVSNVLLQSVAEKFKMRKSFIGEIKPVVWVVLSIALIEIVLTIFWGESVFAFVFGEEWRFSGEISKILVWSYAFNFVIASFTTLFVSLEKIKILSLWQVIYFMAIISLYFFRNLEFITFIKVFVWIEVFAYFIITLLMIYIIVNYEKKVATH